MGIEELDRMRPEAREKYLEIVRNIPPGRKLRQIFEHSDMIRQMMVDGIRHQHPEFTDEQVLDEMRRRILPEGRLRKACG